MQRNMVNLSDLNHEGSHVPKEPEEQFKELEKERAVRRQLEQHAKELARQNELLMAKVQITEKSVEDLTTSNQRAYEKIQEMTVACNRLQQDKVLLISEISSLKAQESIAHDKTVMYNILMERTRKVEEENSSLVLETEMQQRHYERTLDDITKQVVQALMKQKQSRFAGGVPEMSSPPVWVDRRDEYADYYYYDLEDNDDYLDPDGDNHLGDRVDAVSSLPGGAESQYSHYGQRDDVGSSAAALAELQRGGPAHYSPAGKGRPVAMVMTGPQLETEFPAEKEASPRMRLVERRPMVDARQAHSSTGSLEGRGQRSGLGHMVHQAYVSGTSSLARPMGAHEPTHQGYTRSASAEALRESRLVPRSHEAAPPVPQRPPPVKASAAGMSPTAPHPKTPQTTAPHPAAQDSVVMRPKVGGSVRKSRTAPVLSEKSPAAEGGGTTTTRVNRRDAPAEMLERDREATSPGFPADPFSENAESILAKHHSLMVAASNEDLYETLSTCSSESATNSAPSVTLAPAIQAPPKLPPRPSSRAESAISETASGTHRIAGRQPLPLVDDDVVEDSSAPPPLPPKSVGQSEGKRAFRPLPKAPVEEASASSVVSDNFSSKVSNFTSDITNLTQQSSSESST